MAGSPPFDIRELEYRYSRGSQGISAGKEYDAVARDFICAGVLIAAPPDKVPLGKYPFLKNVRSYQAGRIEPRAGQTALTAAVAAGAIHSIKRLNDDANGLFTRLCGAGVKLYGGGGAVLAELDSGYSGDPLSFVTFRPDQSPEPWAYIGDRLRMRKVRIDGTDYATGIAPPNIAPGAIFAAPSVNIIDDLDSAAGWVQGGTAGAPATENRVNTVISQIVYDAGNAGWVSIALADMTNLELSAILKLDAGNVNEERGTVFAVHRAMPSTTIGSIAYDAGNTGLCTIQPVGLSAPAAPRRFARTMLDDDFLAPYDPVIKRSLSRRRVLVDVPSIMPSTSWLTNLGVTPDALVTVGTGGANQEVVKIISVSVGKDGVASIRCKTINTHLAGEKLDGIQSVRMYIGQAHVIGATVTDVDVKTTIATGTGYLSKVTPFNLGLIGFRATQNSDEIHLSVRMDNLANLVEGRVILDIDPAGGFANNCFLHVFRPNDLVPAIKLTASMLSARQRAIQARYVDSTVQNFQRRMPANRRYSDDFGEVDLSARYAVPGGGQTTTGDNQWFDLHFKVSDLVRIGSDKSRGLNDVTGIRVQLTCAGPITVGLDALWIGGSYGPDIGEVGDPYLWRYRFRSKKTGAKSNPSPPMRFGLSPHRQRIQLNATPSVDPQVDAIDWYRWGGVLPEWLYVGTGDNTAANFFDEIPDENLVFSDLLDFDNFQPFPSVDRPKSGTCDVVGTSITWKTGDKFSTSWAPGTLINIGGIVQILYAMPTSDSKLEIVDNAGTIAGATFFINEPVVLAQPSPVIFGPFQGFVFGFDPNRPGTLVFTKGNDPDSAPETYFIEVTDPSSPLLNGGVFDSKVIVASNRGFFGIYPSFDNSSIFTWQELPVGGGLLCRWGIWFGKRVYFVDKDGIFATVGSGKVPITGDLYPLFPHDGQPGQATNGYLPIDMTRTSDIRLSGSDSQLYFDYVDTGGNRCTWMYDEQVNGWFFDTYGTPALTHYAEEGKGVHSLLMGGTDGKLHQSAGLTDNGAAIQCQVRTFADDRNDKRANKLWGDCIVDLDPAENPGGVAITPYFDNSDFHELATVAGDGDVGRNHYLVDIEKGAGKLARNFALDIQWQDTKGVKLYEWEVSSRTKNEDTIRRFTDWNDLGYQGAKFIQGCVIEADTQGITRTVNILGDGGVVVATLAVKHTGQQQQPYSFPPFVAHAIRLAPQDDESWRLDSYRLIWEPAPESAATWVTQGTTHDLREYQHVRDAFIALEATADVVLNVNVDGVDYAYTVPNTGGAYRKQYLPLRAIKGKLFTYSLTSANPFRLYTRDCEVRVRMFDQSGPYAVANPFGDIHRIYGARI